MECQAEALASDFREIIEAVAAVGPALRDFQARPFLSRSSVMWLALGTPAWPQNVNTRYSRPPSDLPLINLHYQRHRNPARAGRHSIPDVSRVRVRVIGVIELSTGTG